MRRTRISAPVIASLAGAAASVLVAAPPSLAQPFGFDPVFELSSLLPSNGGDGSLGFVLLGDGFDDRSGRSVSGVGDVNGDGVEDLIVGAPSADPGSRFNAGASYIVFGRTTGFPAALGLCCLNGTTGFRLEGRNAYDYSGFSVSNAGDVNGDGIDDLIVGAWNAAPGGRSGAGESYVVFGRGTGFPASIALSNLDGATGFRLDGIDSDDESGRSVSAAGDVNGDGVDDVIVGAPRARSVAGESYVVFGRTTGFPASIALLSLNGSTGFRLDGIDASDDSGLSVSGAGDVNGDGVDDMIVGARDGDPGGRSNAGESYVVFGRTNGFPASIALSSLNGSTGFRIDGVNSYDFSGVSVSGAGDVNGDDMDDLIVGTPGGESYVVFGRTTGFPAVLELSSLNGFTGFHIDGDDDAGKSVSGAGDVNGDGIVDLIVGGWEASPDGRIYAGESHVVFGRNSEFPASLSLSSLNGSTGFRINGAGTYDQSGISVSGAGDVNGDGVDDLIVGASGAPDGGGAGESYVVFGRRTCRADWNNDHTLDAFDYDDFVSAYFDYVNNGTGFPDYNQDTYVDAFDYDDFVSDFFTGCG